jgi:hypothetical protein
MGRSNDVEIGILVLRLGSALPSCQSPYYPRPRDRGMAYGYQILQLGFKDAVEVLGGADCDEGVRVCEGGENADSNRFRN